MASPSSTSMSYVNMAKQGVNYTDGVFKNVTRNKGFKILYHHNASIENGIDYESYVGACADAIGADNITAAGRMAGGIIVFVKSTDIVNRICLAGLYVNKVLHTVEALVRPSMTVTISNCPPYVDNSMIIPLIEKHGRIVSAITPIGAQLKRVDLQHICSFRRKVSIIPNDRNVDINSREVVYCAGVNHAIFLSSGGIVCFRCKQKGHKASSCNVNIDRNTETQPKSRKTDNLKLIKKSKIVVDGVRTPTTDSSNDGAPQATIAGESSSEVNANVSMNVDETGTVKDNVKDMDIVSVEVSHDAVSCVPPVVEGGGSDAPATPIRVVRQIESVESLPPPTSCVVGADANVVHLGDTLSTYSGDPEHCDTDLDSTFDDSMSLCSDVSHLSDLSVTELSQNQDITFTPPSRDELFTFIAQIKNSKRQIREATLFCPDLRQLYNRLFTIKDDSKFSNNDKIRIRTLMFRIKSHVGRKHKK